jgi:hypothetical protein
MLSWIMSAFLLASVKSIRNTGDIHFSAFPSVHFSGATRMVRKPCPAAPAMSGPGPSPASSYRVPSHVQQINQEAAKPNLLIALIVSNCVTKVTSAYFIILYIYYILYICNFLYTNDIPMPWRKLESLEHLLCGDSPTALLWDGLSPRNMTKSLQNGHRFALSLPDYRQMKVSLCDIAWYVWC